MLNTVGYTIEMVVRGHGETMNLLVMKPSVRSASVRQFLAHILSSGKAIIPTFYLIAPHGTSAHALRKLASLQLA